MEGCGCVPKKLDVWTLKFEFHTIFTCQEIAFLFWFFLTTYSINTILGAGQMQTGGGPDMASALWARVYQTLGYNCSFGIS